MADNELERIAVALETLSIRLSDMELRLEFLEARSRGSRPFTPAAPRQPERPAPWEIPQQPVPAFPATETPQPLRPNPPDAPSEETVREVSAILDKLIGPDAPAQASSAPATLPAADLPDASPATPAPPVPQPELEFAPQTPPPRTPPASPPPHKPNPRTDPRIADFVSRHATEPRDLRGDRSSTGERERRKLEYSIGKNWAAWLCGIFLVIGVLLFLKYAWDQGWIQPTPMRRIMVAFAAGAALCVTGELLFIRKMNVLAGALLGAGLAVIMATFFAANTLFEPPLIPREAAFLGVLITGLAGIALALHTRALTLAIIALIGMYLSPAILHTNVDASAKFLTYIALVTATGFGVSLVKRNWHAVRWLTVAGTWLWMFIWIEFGHGQAVTHFMLAILAVGVFLLLAVAELLTTCFLARRSTSAEKPSRLVMESQAAISLYINVGAALISAWKIYDHASLADLHLIPLALGVLCLLIWALAPARSVKLSGLILSFAMFTLAVPLYYSDLSITLAWATLSLALAAFAAYSRNRMFHWWALCLFALVIFRLFTFDMFSDRLAQPLFTLGRQTVIWWTLTAWIAAVYAYTLSRLFAVAFRVTPTPGAKLPPLMHPSWLLEVSPRIAAIAAVGIFFIAGARQLSNGSELTLIHVLILGIVARYAKDHVARFAASLLLIFDVFNIFVFDRNDPALQHVLFSLGQQPFTLWLNLAWGSAVAAELLALFAWRSQDPQSKLLARLNAHFGTAIFVLAALATFFGGGELLLLHVLILGAAALIARSPVVRWTALALLSIAMARVIFSAAFNDDLNIIVLQVGTFAVRRWLLLAWVSVIFAQAFALLLRPQADSSADKQQASIIGTAAAALGTICVFGIAIRGDNSYSPLTSLVLAWTILIFLLARFFRGLGYQRQVILLLTALILKWSLIDGITAGVTGNGWAHWPAANLFTLNGLLIATLACIARPTEILSGLPLFKIRAWIIALISFLWLNIELLRTVERLTEGAMGWLGNPWIVKNVSLSLLWALVGFGCVIVGFSKHYAVVRWTGLVVLGFTVLKVLLIDMANVETIWRILSFIVVGLLLLGVSFVYHRQASQDELAEAGSKHANLV